MMDKQEMLHELSCDFFEFCAELGYFEHHVEEHYPFSTEIYAIGHHALSVSIDWRDHYLDMFVIRMVNGNLPREYRETPDRRLCRIPVRHIYDFELPKQIVESDNLDKRMRQILDFLISEVRQNTNLLTDYIANIETYTTPEKTKDYNLKCCQHVIEGLDEDYKNGKISSEIYHLLRRRAVEQMAFYE